MGKDRVIEALLYRIRQLGWIIKSTGEFDDDNNQPVYYVVFTKEDDKEISFDWYFYSCSNTVEWAIGREAHDDYPTVTLNSNEVVLFSRLLICLCGDSIFTAKEMHGMIIDSAKAMEESK